MPALAKVKQLGYDGVEVPLGEWDLADCQKWAGRFQELGLQPIGVAARTHTDNPIHSDPKIRALGVANNRRALDFCQIIGAKSLIGPYHSALNHVCDYSPAPTADEWRWGVDSMRQVAEHAATLGIMLAPEYVNRFECYLVNTAADMVRFVHQVDHPNCRMLYDTFHANIEERDIRQAILGCQAETIHVHISENDRGTPGTGHVDWTTTFNALKETGYDGWMSIEAFGLGAARHVWRRLFADEIELARAGLAFMKDHCPPRDDLAGIPLWLVGRQRPWGLSQSCDSPRGTVPLSPGACKPSRHATHKRRGTGTSAALRSQSPTAAAPQRLGTVPNCASQRGTVPLPPGALSPVPHPSQPRRAESRAGPVATAAAAGLNSCCP